MILLGLRQVIRQDNAPYRALLFQLFLRRRPLARTPYLAISRFKATWVGHLVARLFFLIRAISLEIPHDHRFLTAVGSAIERRMLRVLSARTGSANVGVAHFRIGAALCNLFCWNFWKLALQVLRMNVLFRHLLRDYPLFVVLRCVEFLAYYVRLGNAARVADKILVFSDGNPHGIALFHLAQRYQKKVVFVSHGDPVSPVYPLRCDLAFLWGHESERRYREAGAFLAEVVYCGHRDKYRRIRPIALPVQRIGVFLSKMTTVARVCAVVKELDRDYSPAQIVIRQHPNFPLTRQMADTLRRHSNSLEISAEANLFADAASCDLVLAGNTTAHSEILLGGTASLYCIELEGSDYDRCNHVHQGLVMEWKPGVSFDEINQFYCRPEHTAILRQYVNLEHSQYESLERVARYLFQD